MGTSNEAVQMMLLGDAAEHSSIAVVVWNAERRYVAMNPKAAELVGTTRDTLIEQPVGTTNRSPEAQEMIEDILRHVPSSGSISVGGRELDWLVFPTTVAGLEHVIGLFWDRSELASP